MCHSYGSNTYCRNHEPMIRTEYVHNSHYENPPQSNETSHFENLSLDIYRILWYIKIVIDSMHTFLLGGVGRPAYVRRDPPVHVVRFVRYVTLIGDYYALLRSRFALRLYGFLLDGFATTQHIGKRRKVALCQFVSFCICRLWKNSNYTALRKSDIVISYSRAK